MKERLKKQFPRLFKAYAFVKVAAIHAKEQRRIRRFSRLNEEGKRAYNEQLYLERYGRPLDWDHLLNYSEKMQWAKMYDLDPRKVLCADKYAVREWVKEKIGEEYLIPLLGVWNSVREVDFEQLPNQFVMKTNHGSGDVVIVQDKKSMTLAKKWAIKRKVNRALKMNYSAVYCELHYEKIQPKVIAEQYMEDTAGRLQDYKFLCFDGIPYFCWVDVGRFTDRKRNIYDMEWTLQTWRQGPYGDPREIPKPENFEEMKALARTLSAGFSHVRVDLYNVDGKIYFGEMTFTNGSGFEKVYPESADRMLGDLWKLEMQ